MEETFEETFEEWMIEDGAGVYEEVMNWLEEAPGCVNIHHLLGKSGEEYAMSVCQSEYSGT